MEEKIRLIKNETLVFSYQNQRRPSHTVPIGTAGIYLVGTFVGIETLAFHTSLNTGRTRAVSAISRYILDSDRLMDTGLVQNYTKCFFPSPHASHTFCLPSFLTPLYTNDEAMPFGGEWRHR